MFSVGMKDIIGQEMTKERDKLAKRIDAMEQNIFKAKAALQNDTCRQDSCNFNYSAWDSFEDTDELEAYKDDLNKLNIKIQNHNSFDPNKPCNHKYRCSCSGNKSAERKVVAMKTSDRLEQMALFKKEGNTLYAQKKYKESIALYEKSLIYFEYCFDGNQDELKLADALRLQCLLNAASCFLHLNLYPRCIEYCDEALDIDEISTKAWFRRARAHRLLEKFDNAENDLSKAMGSLGLNLSLKSDIDREIRLLNDDKRRSKKSSTKLATAMIGGLQK